MEEIGAVIRGYEQAHYAALRTQMARYKDLHGAFPDFLIGPKRILAIVAQDGIVVSHWTALEDSYEFRTSDLGVSGLVRELTGGQNVFPNYPPGASLEIAQMVIRSGTEEDAPVLWRSPWDRLEIRPSFNATLWHPAIGEASGAQDVTTFVAAHLMRLNLSTPRDVVLQKLERIIQKFIALIAVNPKEEVVQVFLTENPILLEQRAIRVLPKYKLGAEYVTDFVIVLPNEQYVLVEIEAPKCRLFTQKGDPAKELTHAQRQVEDWRHWVRCQRR